MLQNIKISKKVASLTLLSLVALLVISALELFALREALLEDRKDKVKATTTMLVTAAQSYQDLVDSGELSQEEAVTEFYRVAAASKFDDGTGYFFAYDNKGVNMMHAANPALVGKDLSKLQDPSGSFIIQNMLDVAKAPAGGYFTYLWPKPGHPEEDLFEKQSFAATLPWGDVIGTGIYIDDVDAAFWEQAIFVLVVIAIVIAIMLAVSLPKSPVANLKAKSKVRTVVTKWVTWPAPWSPSASRRLKTRSCRPTSKSLRHRPTSNAVRTSPIWPTALNRVSKA